MGAVLAFHGVEGALPILHGTNFCSHHLGQFLTDHFREKTDIISTNSNDNAWCSGAKENIFSIIENAIYQYKPAMIGFTASCLSQQNNEEISNAIDRMNTISDETCLVHVNLSPYSSTHIDGFHQTVKAIVDSFCPKSFSAGKKKPKQGGINLFPGLISNEDIRHFKEIFDDFKTAATILPDYSERLEGPSWVEPHTIREGGTPIKKIKKMHLSTTSIELGLVLEQTVRVGIQTAGSYLENRFNIPCTRMGYPIGTKATDQFFKNMEFLTGKPTPEKYQRQRQRLIDSYVDGNHYVSKKKAVVYGDEDFILSLVGFLSEIGIIPVLCASDGKSGLFRKTLLSHLPDNIKNRVSVHSNLDFNQISSKAERLNPDLVIGSSRGAEMAKKLKIPLIRVGFPIHDRMGGTRLLHIGYKGTQQMFDTIVNCMIRNQQEVA